MWEWRRKGGGGFQTEVLLFLQTGRDIDRFTQFEIKVVFVLQLIAFHVKRQAIVWFGVNMRIVTGKLSTPVCLIPMFPLGACIRAQRIHSH